VNIKIVARPRARFLRRLGLLRSCECRPQLQDE
jgi:hypothetical protein